MNTTEKIQTYLNDPKIVSVNTVDAHSDHKYFESLAEFSEGEMKLRQSLNGKWKIHYAQNTNQVLKDFYKTEFDEVKLDDVFDIISKFEKIVDENDILNKLQNLTT